METVVQQVNSMPDQHISSTKKSDNWAKRCVRAIKSMSTTRDANGRSSRENKEINYDLVNSIFREEDFDYVLNPYGFDIRKYGGTATKMQNYNIIRSRLETLRGEEMNSPLDFFVYAIAGEVVSAKKMKRKEMLKELMKASIRMELELDETITQLEEQIKQLQAQVSNSQDQALVQKAEAQMQQLISQRNNLPDIQIEMKKFNSEYRDPVEEVNNKILKFLKRKDQLALTFNQGWFHALVSAEEVYATTIERGHPHARAVNPLQLDFDKGANTTFIQNGNWVKEEFWVPSGEVISMFGDVLTDDQVRRISQGLAGNVVSRGDMVQGFGYSFDGGQRPSSFINGNASHVYIMTCAWRSYAKVGMLTYKDPRTGKEITVEVDDTFKLTPELEALGATIEWQWDDEIWEGTMIGDSDFVNLRRRPNQTGNLPYIGYIYNNVNSVSTSVVDLVKPHQYTTIIVWWRLEQELAKAKGRKFVMDFAQLPQSMGWDVDQWMYYFENMGVIWINSREEGRKGDPSTISQFNQFQSIDMSLSQVVGQYMEVLAKLEQMVEDIMGVSPQRMGQISSQETATGAQTAISRSTNVTKPLFYFHDLVKEATLTELLELAKIAYIDDAEIEFLDALEVQTLKITGGDLNASDMAVFVTNSYEDRRKRERMEELLVMAVQQGKASLMDVANVIDSESMSYTKGKLDESERKAVEREQASTQAQIESQEKLAAAEREDKTLERTSRESIAKAQVEAQILIKKMELGMSPDATPNELEITKTLSDIEIARRDMDLKEKQEETRKKEEQERLRIEEKKVNKMNNSPKQ